MHAKRLFFCLLLSLSLFSIRAQHYRGSIDFSISKGVVDLAYENTNCNLVIGVQINPHFYLGIGAGISALESMKAIYAPVFLDFEATLNQNKLSPFVDLRCGYAFNLYNDLSEVYSLDVKGLYYAAYIGYRCKLNEKKALKLSIGYDTVSADKSNGYQSGSGTDKKYLGSLGLRLTYQF